MVFGCFIVLYCLIVTEMHRLLSIVALGLGTCVNTYWRFKRETYALVLLLEHFFLYISTRSNSELWRV